MIILISIYFFSILAGNKVKTYIYRIDRANNKALNLNPEEPGPFLTFIKKKQSERSHISENIDILLFSASTRHNCSR